MKALQIKWKRDNGCCLLTRNYSSHAKTWKLVNKNELGIDKPSPLFMAVLDNASGFVLSYNTRWVLFI